MRAHLGFVVLAACWTAPPIAPRPKPPAGPSCLRDVASTRMGQWLVAEVDGGTLRVCSAHTIAGDNDESSDQLACIGIELATGALVRQPAELLHDPVPQGSYEMVRGIAMACSADGRCRRVGPELAAAAGELTSPRVSADGGFVAADHAVWDVAADRKLAFAAPDDVDTSYLWTASYAFLRDFVIGSWTPCAGPCTVERVFLRDGTVVLDEAQGESLALLADGRLAVLDHDLAIYDGPLVARRIDVFPHGRTHGDDQAGGEVPEPLVVLPDGRIAAVTRQDHAIEIAVADVARGEVVRRLEVPICSGAR